MIVDINHEIGSTCMLMASVRQGRDDLVLRILAMAGLHEAVTNVKADIEAAPQSQSMRDTLSIWLLREGDGLSGHKDSGLNLRRMNIFRTEG
jgi:hypothetical protein